MLNYNPNLSNSLVVALIAIKKALTPIAHSLIVIKKTLTPIAHSLTAIQKP